MMNPVVKLGCGAPSEASAGTSHLGQIRNDAPRAKLSTDRAKIHSPYVGVYGYGICALRATYSPIPTHHV
jgi:hypothetical protein